MSKPNKPAKKQQDDSTTPNTSLERKSNSQGSRRNLAPYATRRLKLLLKQIHKQLVAKKMDPSTICLIRGISVATLLTNSMLVNVNLEINIEKCLPNINTCLQLIIHNDDDSPKN